MQALDLNGFLQSNNNKTEFEISVRDLPEYFPGISVRLPFTVRIQIEKKERFVSVILTCDVTADSLCSRCAEPALLSDSYASEWDIETTDSDENGFILNGMLDVDALLDETLYVNLPSVILCREECLGLCHKCGKNLNYGKCSCKEERRDPRMLAFAKYLENNNNDTALKEVQKNGCTKA